MDGWIDGWKSNSLFSFFLFFFPFRERCMVALVFFPDTRVFCLFCLFTLNSFLSLGGDLDVFFYIEGGGCGHGESLGW